MPRALSNGIELCYETHGERRGRPLVLIMGLGAQLIAWPPGFINRLVSRGHFVVCFDNRDVGESTSFIASGKVDLRGLLVGISQGTPPEIPYRMSQLADDVVGLLDALELHSVHLVGVSMGGRIAQHVAIAVPERVRSLTSIMSATGAADLPLLRPHVLAKLFAPDPADPDEELERGVDMHRTICANDDDFDEARVREMLLLARARGFDRACVSRQMAAIFLSEDSEPALRRLRIPALVMHGARDPLVQVECGLRTHACLEGSRLSIDQRMGHYLPGRVHHAMADAISELTERSDGGRVRSIR